MGASHKATFGQRARLYLSFLRRIPAAGGHPSHPGSPFHPRTNGKLERHHRTIKLDVNQIPYDVPGNLEVAITEFVSYYNNRRYHKAQGNVTPSDVLDGRREQILQKRKEVQTQTFQSRRLCNQQLRELAQSAPNLH